MAVHFPDESGCLDHCGRRADRSRSGADAEGQDIKVFWRGKPIYISHRTKKQIDEARSVPVSSLPDPQTDQARVKEGHDQWLVVVGICTHLGCIPIAHEAITTASSAPATARNTIPRVVFARDPRRPTCGAALSIRFRQQNPDRLSLGFEPENSSPRRVRLISPGDRI